VCPVRVLLLLLLAMTSCTTSLAEGCLSAFDVLQAAAMREGVVKSSA
jgi:hypothetical protein